MMAKRPTDGDLESWREQVMNLVRQAYSMPAKARLQPVIFTMATKHPGGAEMSYPTPRMLRLYDDMSPEEIREECVKYLRKTASVAYCLMVPAEELEDDDVVRQGAIIFFQKLGFAKTELWRAKVHGRELDEFERLENNRIFASTSSFEGLFPQVN